MEEIKSIVEAALMSARRPLNLRELAGLFARHPHPPDARALRTVLDALRRDYENRGVELKEVASGFRFQVRSCHAPWVNRLWEERPPRYSRALLETLAIIAYRQPVTRGEIEDIRGVSLSPGIVHTLQGRGWIRVVGHREVPGRPELLASTPEFLDYFNLKQLSDLPPIEKLRDGTRPEEQPLAGPEERAGTEALTAAVEATLVEGTPLAEAAPALLFDAENAQGGDGDLPEAADLDESAASATA